MKLRKHREQIEILKKEFIKNPYWDKPKIKELASFLELSPSQVYKWNWDQRNNLQSYLSQRKKVFIQS